MIETFKILQNYYDPYVSPKLQRHDQLHHNLRGNSLKLRKLQARTNLRLYSFPLRITSVWNSLPNHVIEAPSINAFKNRLDKYWSNQELLFNYKADLSLTGCQTLTEEAAEELAIKD